MILNMKVEVENSCASVCMETRCRSVHKADMSCRLQHLLHFAKCHWSATDSMRSRFRDGGKIKYCSSVREMNPCPIMPYFSLFFMFIDKFITSREVKK